jgi:tRNA G18 (ribose-2'-O)-methylase SpoU
MHDLAATFGEETLLRGGGGGGASRSDDEDDETDAEGVASTPRSSSSLELRALRATLAMLRENKDAAKTREACGPVMTGAADATPRGMLAGSLDVEPASSDSATRGADRFGFEGVPTSALDRVEAFLRRSREELRRERELVDAALWEDALREKGRAGDGVGGAGDLGRVSGAGESLVGPDGRLLVRAPAGASTRETRENRSPAGVRTPGFAALQKKVEPPERAAAAEREGAFASERYASEEESESNSDSDLENSDSDPTRTRGARRKKTGGNGAPPRRPPGLIVVASLVDKLPNLAGLARTCEVLGAEALVVADAKVFAKPEFASISVTAERWLPTREVPRNRLGAYLEALRREGYWLVGLEQTRGATSLDAFRFREKTALVLGREREGVDADVLARLDECVVIPQEGLIRSLNVHVSASVAVAEYAAARRRGGLVREGAGGWGW